MKYVSLTWIVSGIIASITPEMPPSVNIVRKPSANSIGVSRWMTPRQSVASQEKILIPVGTAMIAVVTIIGMRIHDCMPDTNMWWAHTVKPSTTMTSSEVEKFAHTSSGMRKKLMPGARMVMIVTRKFSAVAMDDAPANCTPIVKKSWPIGAVVDSGA